MLNIPHLLEYFIDQYFRVRSLLCLYRRVFKYEVHDGGYRAIVSEAFHLSSNMMMNNWDVGFSYLPISFLLTNLFPWNEYGTLTSFISGPNHLRAV
jgi:hypothetical protein